MIGGAYDTPCAKDLHYANHVREIAIDWRKRSCNFMVSANQAFDFKGLIILCFLVLF
jgi:hypothetical protein